MADAEGIDTGRERSHGGGLDPDRGRDGLHLERVGHHDAVEAELLAQEALHERGVDGRRQLVHPDVRGHDRLDARLDRRPERLEPRVDVADEHRQLEVRILLVEP